MSLYDWVLLDGQRACSTRCTGLEQHAQVRLPLSFCLAGSSNPSQYSCGQGQYSLAGASVCTNCSAGLFGASTGLPAAECSGQCLAGSYCPAGSKTGSPFMCPAGSVCPAGSPNGSVLCPPGQYSLLQASMCSFCESGRFGSVSGLTSSACSGVCWAGYMCPMGSVNATTTPCPLAHYCTPGTSAPVACAGGVYGNTTRLSSSQCSGQCPAGFFCPGNFKCLQCMHKDGGYWEPAPLLKWPRTCVHGWCLPILVSFAGSTVDPIACGNATVYCPVASMAPVIVPMGFYSVGLVGDSDGGASTMAQALECPKGYWCSSGTRTPCGPGRYAGSTKSSSPADCRTCPAGRYCGTSE
jgi:hypothetical protein